MKIVQALKAPGAAPRIQDSSRVERDYSHWRIRTLYATFLGYAVFYFTRKNLSAATPALLADLHYSKTELGAIWSILYLTYGLSKFVNGVIGDRSNPRYFMAIGLVLSALCNLAFGMSSSLFMLGFFWALNGWVQGMGWPPCARLLTAWYSGSERGRWWALWNTSHQVGGGLILIWGGYLAQNHGWRSAFFWPSAVAIGCAFFLVNRLRDTPESLGLPPVEEFRNDYSGAVKDTETGPVHSTRNILVEHVLKNREIWFLALANFFVYIVRYGAMDWAPTFLVEVKKSTIASAAAKTALFEMIGIAGAFLAGFLSDTVFKGRRYVVNVLYMIVLTFAVLGFWMIPAGQPMLDATLLSAVGFLVYGPQMLVGVCAADSASRFAAGTATGFTGLFGYIGSIVSGVGVGWVVDHYGWNGGFFFLAGCSILGATLFVFTRTQKQTI